MDTIVITCVMVSILSLDLPFISILSYGLLFSSILLDDYPLLVFY